MDGKIKRGLCWALNALQVTQEAEEAGKSELVNDDLIPQKRFVDLQSALRTEHKVGTGGDENVRPNVSDKNKNNGKKCDENVRPLYARKDIADHCSSQSCWMVINNKVYDVTRFLRMHPGGDDIMLEYGGHDATSAFIDKGHSVDAYEMLSEYCIGEVAKADWFPEKNFT